MDHNHNEENEFQNLGKEEQENIEKMVEDVWEETASTENENAAEDKPDAETKEDTKVEVNYVDETPEEEPSADASVDEPIDEMARITQEKDEIRDKYLRLHAEFDNFRKRTAKERVELLKTAGQGVIKDILPVLDDFERAMKALDIDKDNPQKEDEGMRLIYHKLLRNLGNQGLTQMETMGEIFDADLHEAITDIPAGEEMKGKIVDVIEQGYYLNEKIIRYAKVVVGR